MKAFERLAWLLLLAALPAACGGDEPPPTPRERAVERQEIRLPNAVWPNHLAFSEDGAMWVTESSGDAIARIGTDGAIRQFRIPGTENSPGDIVAGRDGAIWFAGFMVLGRIGPDGRLRGWEGLDAGIPGALAAGPDGAVWFTDEGLGPEVGRATESGITRFRVGDRDADLEMPGIAAGPDGALWLTQRAVAEGGYEAIGRLTTDGDYRAFRLPHRRSGPNRIVAGPDDALWFTEQTAYRIGRITTSGEITEFPLEPGMSPFDITSGRDGALWFTLDRRVGRISTEGRVSTWPVPRAKRLIGIESAPDGSLWLTDGPGDAVRRFVPPDR